VNIQNSGSQGEPRISLSGTFTFADHALFRDAVIAQIDQPDGAAMVLDLTALDYIDSAGLGMLLLARDAALRHGRAVTLAKARDQVARILAVSKFNLLFDLRP
jgi:anti-anti-sigma factor